jgi:nicotinate-nucleotide pyrophosphorylase (carboxylating)
MMLTKEAEELIDIAITEDLGDGDHTSLSCIPNDAKGQAKLLVKEKGILAGVEIAKLVFAKIDPTIKFSQFLNDGDSINIGDIAFSVEGNAQNILRAERLALNFMQRMSGIATQTNVYASIIAHTNAKVLDTRKTTPGLRYFEKLAVKIGGGENHRIGLYDLIMIKDNHIDFTGGITEALLKTYQYLKETNRNLKVEVEARNLEEVKEIMGTGLGNRIMLDNFTIEDTLKAVALIDEKYETESSGGITLKTIKSYAECGVDFISVGALTHQIKSLDLSLKATF